MALILTSHGCKRYSVAPRQPLFYLAAFLNLYEERPPQKHKHGRLKLPEEDSVCHALTEARSMVVAEMAGLDTLAGGPLSVIFTFKQSWGCPRWHSRKDGE